MGAIVPRKASNVSPRSVWNKLLSGRTKPLRRASERRRNCSGKLSNVDASLKSGNISCFNKERVCTYWRTIPVETRRRILLVDDPSLVKQLYKLNLSLLCVGLMQRNKQSKGTKRRGPELIEGSSNTSPSSKTSCGGSYELLEAMEFMDIETGILTVKEELIQDPTDFFSLLEKSLSRIGAGFLASTTILSLPDFDTMFLKESESVQNWADYEFLIGVLIEQLILRSFVAHLETVARESMEQLLLAECKTSSTRRKKKKRRKKSNVVPDEIPKESLSSSPLNPRASAFRPQVVAHRCSSDLKRKHRVIVSIEKHDRVYDSGDCDEESYLLSSDESYTRDENLDFHLSRVYDKTFCMLGWDAVSQSTCRDIQAPEGGGWNYSMTRPDKVVKYFANDGTKRPSFTIPTSSLEPPLNVGSSNFLFRKDDPIDTLI